MTIRFRPYVTSLALASAVCVPLLASQRQTPPPAAAGPIAVCKLLTRDEVKKHLPWEALFDRFPDEEIAIGTSGSSCEYPSVGVQVLPFTPQFQETARKSGFTEPVPNVGDEAYYRMSPSGNAEIYVKVGARILTIQAPASQKADAVKAGVISLARAYAAKLR